MAKRLISFVCTQIELCIIVSKQAVKCLFAEYTCDDNLFVSTSVPPYPHTLPPTPS